MEMTHDELRQSLPTQFKGKVSDELLQAFNDRLSEDIADFAKENLVTYNSVLLEGKYKLGYYLDVVMYCSYKLSGLSHQEAWKKVFPDRYNKLLKEGRSAKEISTHVAAFNNRPMVHKILAQAMIPSYLLNAHYYQEAINKQVELIRTSQSERIQMEAANSLLTHLKPPEVKKIELDVGVNTSNALEDLRMATIALAKKQRELIEEGSFTAKEAAHQGVVIDGN